MSPRYVSGRGGVQGCFRDTDVEDGVVITTTAGPSTCRHIPRSIAPERTLQVDVTSEAEDEGSGEKEEEEGEKFTTDSTLTPSPDWRSGIDKAHTRAVNLNYLSGL